VIVTGGMRGSRKINCSEVLNASFRATPESRFVRQDCKSICHTWSKRANSSVLTHRCSHPLTQAHAISVQKSIHVAPESQSLRFVPNLPLRSWANSAKPSGLAHTRSCDHYPHRLQNVDQFDSRRAIKSVGLVSHGPAVVRDILGRTPRTISFCVSTISGFVGCSPGAPGAEVKVNRAPSARTVTERRRGSVDRIILCSYVHIKSKAWRHLR
jgi:hypothetical protein